MADGNATEAPAPGEVILYSTEPCGYCARAKELLTARGVEFREINLARDMVGRHALLDRTGLMTFPQLAIGERILGGYREMVELDRRGALAETIEAAVRAAA